MGIFERRSITPREAQHIAEDAAFKAANLTADRIAANLDAAQVNPDVDLSTQAAQSAESSAERAEAAAERIEETRPVAPTVVEDHGHDHENENGRNIAGIGIAAGLILAGLGFGAWGVSEAVENLRDDERTNEPLYSEYDLNKDDVITKEEVNQVLTDDRNEVSQQLTDKDEEATDNTSTKRDDGEEEVEVTQTTNGKQEKLFFGKNIVIEPKETIVVEGPAVLSGDIEVEGNAVYDDGEEADDTADIVVFPNGVRVRVNAPWGASGLKEIEAKALQEWINQTVEAKRDNEGFDEVRIFEVENDGVKRVR